MQFEQVGPRRSEAPDGTVVELVDRHHAQLHTPRGGMWLVELGPGPDEDWLAITVYADSLLRAGGQPDERAAERALALLVAGLRALRVRVSVTHALAGTDTDEPSDDGPGDDGPGGGVAG